VVAPRPIALDGGSDAILTLGPLQLTGTAGFALTLSTVDADTNGDGAADLLGATLTGLALDVSGLGVEIEDVAHLSAHGAIGLLRVALENNRERFR